MRASKLTLLQGLDGVCYIQAAVAHDHVKAARAQYDELNGQDVEITVTKWRERRSLDANAYCWVLIGKLAAKVGVPPEDIYREQIRAVGDNFTIVPIRNDAVDRWRDIWQARGMGWMTDTLGSKLDGYTNVICYYGSSVYDTSQMSRLISLVVDECKAQGIETLTPNELARMLEDWDAK